MSYLIVSFSFNRTLGFEFLMLNEKSLRPHDGRTFTIGFGNYSHPSS